MPIWCPSYPIFGVFASLCATGTYLDHWTPWWIVADCGDRLEEILDGGSGIATVPEADEYAPVPDGLTPEQIFGLGPGFMRWQLDRARRRLITQLHPDLAHGAAPAIRCAREEALKSVNAAYDQLRQSALRA